MGREFIFLLNTEREAMLFLSGLNYCRAKALSINGVSFREDLNLWQVSINDRDYIPNFWSSLSGKVETGIYDLTTQDNTLFEFNKCWRK